MISWNSPLLIGKLALKNRVVMAAMTRMRTIQGVPNHLLVKYYGQRSGAGLILTQCASVSKQGDGFPGAACIYSVQQMEGWKNVVKQVHQNDGKIALQIYHGGRACRKSTNGGIQTIAPSAIQIVGPKSQMPKQMTLEEIEKVKGEFQNSFKLTKQAGFDAIQLHAANGYLVDSFIKSASNKRTDSYGGSVQNRCKFVLELVQIALKYFQNYQIGVKISPVSQYNSMFDQKPLQTFSHLLKRLDQLKIGFVQIVRQSEAFWNPELNPVNPKQQMGNVLKALRSNFKGIIIGNNGFTSQSGLEYLNQGICQAVSFGTFYIGNPDLAERLIKGQKINQTVDMSTWFGRGDGDGSKGYIDFPRFEQQKKG